MQDPRQIITMTKLAIYDKENADEDINIDRFFRHDYIYRQNMWLRLYVLVGCLIVIGFRVLHMLAVEQINLFELDLRAQLIKATMFILVVEGIYSLIGTIRHTILYERSQKRMKKYFALVTELEALRAQNHPAPPQRKEPNHAPGTTSMDTRKHHKLL